MAAHAHFTHQNFDGSKSLVGAQAIRACAERRKGGWECSGSTSPTETARPCRRCSGLGARELLYPQPSLKTHRGGLPPVSARDRGLWSRSRTTPRGDVAPRRLEAARSLAPFDSQNLRDNLVSSVKPRSNETTPGTSWALLPKGSPLTAGDADASFFADAIFCNRRTHGYDLYDRQRSPEGRRALFATLSKSPFLMTAFAARRTSRTRSRL
ncbi:MAG: hypothetical protein UY77_C0002G0016 [Candidatus Uhrbacteria bacterium GW2011_GWA2_53_10]|uniref:Uncharacterized protein n=1 Tax=Candidatus Uhrbacteria bacterium GW2011_GWA2_53_10 TaxID=1618980 RepID=A0A0G1XPU7_9BACT|nr:MAG: hypothetical protein UY77_C0002G0016 [Candidatus Uhrbacteria bacterium GW2011_GWA2_53_10]